MLIGAHVSISGGLDKAIERGSERGRTAIQIFSQSPRMWRPNKYSQEDFEAFRNAMAKSPIDFVVIHALYLINSASDDRELWEKSVTALTHTLRVGDAIGAAGVVLHPGNQKDQPYEDAIGRINEAIGRALGESDRCPLLLENSGGAKAVGKTFEELSDLIELAGGDKRLGVCIDSCHALVAGYDVRTAATLSDTIDRFDAIVGLDRLGCVHLNDSKAPLGSFRDRHENIGQGELGEQGCIAWLSEPRFEDLALVMETPGPDGHGTDGSQVALAREYRERGLLARS